jgi:CheY-like chemotaxis protein
LDLLNEILDFSKLESGKFALQSVGFHLRTLIDDVRRTYEFPLAEKAVDLRVEVDDRLPDEYVGDPTRLRQVLVNLLSNAAKFTDEGRVSIRVAAGAINQGDAEVSFTVEDTGIGISAEDQARVFMPFTQVDASVSRRQTGIGLGLAIASDLVNAMGGVLNVKSELGIGSAFSFSIPLKREAEWKSAQSMDGNGRGSVVRPKLADMPLVDPLHVLLAEDVPANQMLVCRALSRRGHKVEVARNGQEAIELATTQRFDVILMDVQMPGIDGLQATATLRGHDLTAGVPIIALTAHAMAGDRQRCLDAGMDGYLAKPLDLAQLVQTVESYAPQPVTDAIED